MLWCPFFCCCIDNKVNSIFSIHVAFSYITIPSNSFGFGVFLLTDNERQMIPLTGWGRFLTSFATCEFSHGQVHDIVIIYGRFLKLFSTETAWPNEPKLGRSSIKIAHFVPVRSQTWPPQAIVVSDWLISKKKSSPLKPLGQMNRNLVGSTYLKKYSPFKMLGQMNRNLVGSIYGMFCIKFPENRMKSERRTLVALSLLPNISFSSNLPSPHFP